MNNQEVYGLIWVDICTINKFRVRNKIIQNVKDRKKQEWPLMLPSFYSAVTAREIRSRRWKNCCNAVEEMTRWINACEVMTKKVTTDQGLRQSKRRRYAFTATTLFISTSYSSDYRSAYSFSSFFAFKIIVSKFFIGNSLPLKVISLLQREKKNKI